MTVSKLFVAPTVESESSDQPDFHYIKRGEAIGDVVNTEAIEGFDVSLMAARTLLTVEEEKKLLRRIDWHLMPLCSLMFLFKNMDSENVRDPAADSRMSSNAASYPMRE